MNTDARVIVVEADLKRARVTCSVEEFYGVDDEGNKVRDASEYSALRSRLMAEGLDALVTDDIGDDAGTWVIFDPNAIRIVGEMAVDDAYEATSASSYDALEMVWGGELFESKRAKASSRRKR